MAHMPLNKYIAQTGLCSRRKAVDYIKQKKVTINERVVVDPGYKVQDDDVVAVDGRTLHVESLVYILLNKPKNCVSTASDEKGRTTVLDVIHGATSVRVYPVGRLDRNTTGLLLLTNDGSLAQRLAHPKYQVQKVYHVTLDRVVAKKDIERIQKGVMLDDGKVLVDAVDYIPPSKKKIRIVVHIGRYRVIRRLFEKLGYKVAALDRVQYAQFTKRGLSRGAWRHLTPKEVHSLKS